MSRQDLIIHGLELDNEKSLKEVVLMGMMGMMRELGKERIDEGDIFRKRNLG